MEPAADVRAVNRPPRHHWERTSASQPIEAEAGRVTTLELFFDLVLVLTITHRFVPTARRPNAREAPAMTLVIWG
jgi:low temperature requirement protein LtrA